MPEQFCDACALNRAAKLTGVIWPLKVERERVQGGRRKCVI